MLATETGGEYNVAGTADNIVNIVIEVITNHANEGSDLMFLIDKTGSMGDDISAVQNGLSAILDTLPENCRIGLASYGDLACDSLWTGGSWFDFQDLTNEYDLVQLLIDNLPYFSIALFYVGLLTHKGKVEKAWDDVKN